MVIKRVFEKLREEPGITSVVVNRIEELMGRFVTPEAFFSAEKGALLKQWHDMGNNRDLGDKFYEAFDVALRLYRTPDEDLPGPDRRKFSRDELKALVDMMELMEVPAMDCTEMAFVLNMRKPAPASALDQEAAR